MTSQTSSGNDPKIDPSAPEPADSKLYPSLSAKPCQNHLERRGKGFTCCGACSSSSEHSHKHSREITPPTKPEA